MLHTVLYLENGIDVRICISLMKALRPPVFYIGITKRTHSFLSILNGWDFNDGSVGDVLSFVLMDIRKAFIFVKCQVCL